MIIGFSELLVGGVELFEWLFEFPNLLLKLSNDCQVLGWCLVGGD